MAAGDVVATVDVAATVDFAAADGAMAGSRQASNACNGNGIPPMWNEVFTFAQNRRELVAEHAAIAIELFQRQKVLMPPL